jgi:hypothetical protein
LSYKKLLHIINAGSVYAEANLRVFSNIEKYKAELSRSALYFDSSTIRYYIK